MAWLAGTLSRDSRRGTVAHRSGRAEERAQQRPVVRIGPARAGRYVITDEAGHRIGTIFGDYVIGFSVSCWDMQWTFKDLDEAKVTLQLEAEARAQAGQRVASYA